MFINFILLFLGAITIDSLGNTDLNNVINDGFYVIWDTCTNTPASGFWGGYMIVMRPNKNADDGTGNNFVFQMCYDMNTGGLYIRTRWGSTTWSSWRVM